MHVQLIRLLVDVWAYCKVRKVGHNNCAKYSLDLVIGTEYIEVIISDQWAVRYLHYYSSQISRLECEGLLCRLHEIDSCLCASVRASHTCMCVSDAYTCMYC